MKEQTARKIPRPRPLETCGATMLSMSRVVYTRTKTLNNPASFLVQKLYQLLCFFASMTSPFHRHFLALLSVADDHILAIETYFPSTTSLFTKISGLLNAAEHLPIKLDVFLEKLPRMMNRAAWVDMFLVQALYWVDCLVNVLGHWRDKNRGTNEKEITVDSSFSRTGSMSEEEMKLGNDGKRVTYKEVLQRGSSGEDGGGSTGRSSSNHGDPILDLFENGWIQKPMKRSSRSADSLTCSRSDSFETTT
ncbi:Transmembrane protein [Hirschfeldia incana]|nr:Transmembrane protein [Hirschfeldia incana]